VRGAVQGVGFRPFVYRLANELHLTGWVNNTPQGVFIEVEGARRAVAEFKFRLPSEAPPLARIISIEARELAPLDFTTFEIRESGKSGSKTTIILPDIAVCSECLREMFDPSDRRYRYPFINCTHCGPRYSIIQRLPYDRPNTTMAAFKMCSNCQAEYQAPTDRRFHAQPIACPKCGPTAELWNPSGKVVARADEAIGTAIAALRDSKIVALKGLGGFHLLVNAGNSSAVHALRNRKKRGSKPFAVMFPSLESVKRSCETSLEECQLLLSPEAPIVLLWRKSCLEVSAEVAPGNPYLGAMLPYAPLHHLLMHDFGAPLVATSGNLSDEPICTDEHEALERLRGIADFFLVHNRPIARQVDDSVLRIINGREQVLRRARGLAPLPISLSTAHVGVLAFGGHLKNTVALSTDCGVVISQHIGDLDARPGADAFDRICSDIAQLYDVKPSLAVCDLHPDYYSTLRATESRLPLVRVQHHLAHVLSCAAENETPPPYLGVAWDGTGYGGDGKVWGGEFFTVDESRIKHWGTILPIPLIGGDAAAREPRRSALGVLWETFGEVTLAMADLPSITALNSREIEGFGGMLKRGINCKPATSMGRLFDAVSSLANLCQHNRFEGEAAMALEFSARNVRPEGAYHFEWITAHHDAGARDSLLIAGRTADKNDLISPPPQMYLDWRPVIRQIVEEVRTGIEAKYISARFHEGLAEAIVAGAKFSGQTTVVLSGGCFLNRLLTERTVKGLAEARLTAILHQRVPPGDGGISLGQLAALRWI